MTESQLQQAHELQYKLDIFENCKCTINDKKNAIRNIRVELADDNADFMISDVDMITELKVELDRIFTKHIDRLKVEFTKL